MKKKLIFLLALSSTLIFTFCKSGTDVNSIVEAITALENEYGADPGNARSKINPLLVKYEEYVAHPEGDEKTKIDYLLRAGEMAALVEQYGKSLGYYEQILTEYPNSEKVATALFMKGYTLDDKLKKLDDAKAVYEEFLAKYPEDEFADDTKFLLENLGKSEEEIIKQFESK
ncbi:MAG: tetratricopeptide repeat protein [Bacteroidota bacterium]